MTAALEVEDLRVEIKTARGVARPVDGVSFTLEAGEALGLVGESGSGKTLTLRAILGLLPRRARLASGRVQLSGQVLATPADLRRSRGRGIGMVFQEPQSALNPVMRVGDQIAEGPRVVLGRSGREAQAQAVELMRRVGIAAPERRALSYPHELSGGMLQRVVIAIALSLEPSVLLCDEPTTALDVTIQEQILQLLVELQVSTGVAVLYVSHDLAVVAQLCRRVAVMYAGRLVETGPIGEVFAAPAHPYTRALLRSVVDLDAIHEPEPIPGAPPDPVLPPAGCRFHPRCSFRREACSSGDYTLEPITPERSTACPYHADMASAS